jgi:error-prone DNA polymerase
LRSPAAIGGFGLIVGSRLVFADATPAIIAYPRHGMAGRLTRLLTVGNSGGEGRCILHFADLMAHAEDLC